MLQLHSGFSVAQFANPINDYHFLINPLTHSILFSATWHPLEGGFSPFHRQQR
jgi:hypothetical protein